MPERPGRDARPTAISPVRAFPAIGFKSVRVPVADVLGSDCRLLHELWDGLRGARFRKPPWDFLRSLSPETRCWPLRKTSWMEPAILRPS